MIHLYQQIHVVIVNLVFLDYAEHQDTQNIISHLMPKLSPKKSTLFERHSKVPSLKYDAQNINTSLQAKYLWYCASDIAELLNDASGGNKQ